MKQVVGFSRYGKFFLALSLIMIVAGIVFTVQFQGGLNLGIDFQSGITMTIEIDSSSTSDSEQLRTLLAPLGAASVQELLGQANRYLVKLTSEYASGTDSDTAANSDSDNLNANTDNTSDDAAVSSSTTEDDSANVSSHGSTSANTLLQQQAIIVLESQYGDGSITVLESALIEPRFSQTIARQSVLLTGAALLLILLYIWIRFKFRFAISAVLALLHDVFATVAFLGVAQIEVSTTTIAAILTIVGYSLNDTVVIFDRIRENIALSKKTEPLRVILDTSITQSLSRTIITSLTTLLAVVAIYVFSRGSIRDFAVTMIFGIFSGTYSSIFVASPFLSIISQGDANKLRSKRDSKDAGIVSTTTVATSTSASASVPTRMAQSSVDTEQIKKQLQLQRSRQQHKPRKKKR